MAINKDGLIIKDSKDEPIDTSVLFENEYFLYCGKKYVKKINHDYMKDENDRDVYEQKVLPDGHLINTVQKKGKEWDEFFELETVRSDTPDIIAKHGRPMTTQIIPHGPIDPKALFKYEGEEIRYENTDLQELVLKRLGNKIVKVSGEVRKSRHAKELGYWK